MRPPHPHLAALFRPAWIAVLAISSLPAGAGPLDPPDKAAVVVIDGKVTDALDTAIDIRGGTGDLILESTEDALRIAKVQAYARAQLRLDLERSLLETCAVACAKKPLPPASPESDDRCWTCVSPRLVITRANGGYLDDVLFLVQTDLNQARDTALPADLDRAELLLELAATAFALDAVEESFTHACQAYGVLACERGGRKQ